MDKQEELIKRYVSNTSKPTFNHFARKETKLIEKISILLESASPISLQRDWVKAYNNCVQIERPGEKLQSRPTAASVFFKRMFDIAKATRDSVHDFKVSSLQISGSVYSASRSDFLDSSTHEVREEREEEKEEEEQIEEEREEEVGLAKVESEELEKLNKSHCINLLSKPFKNHASQSLPQDAYVDIKFKCISLRSQFKESLTPEISKLINDLFDDIKQFQFDCDVASITEYLDIEKSKITNKRSEKYTLLLIIGSFVKNFNLWKKEEKLSENTYLRKFAEIVETLFENSKLFIKDGENVCEATKRMQMINGGDVVYGRRIDLLVSSEQDDKDIELCSVEFKKGDASYSLLLHQQCKNLRINACIMNDIHLLTHDKDICVTYLDFSGRNAYIAQLFQHDNNFIAHEVGKAVFVKSLLELDILRETILDLYRWKKSLIQNSNKVSLAYINQCNKYTLSDISQSNSAPSTPPHSTPPQAAKIFLSPSNAGKRSRTVFESD